MKGEKVVTQHSKVELGPHISCCNGARLSTRLPGRFNTVTFQLLVPVSRWHRSARKGPYAPRHFSPQSPPGCPRNSGNICLVERRSFLALEGGMSATSFLHSSFLQAINAVMLWPVHVQKVPQASEHVCSAKLQTRWDIRCAC